MEKYIVTVPLELEIKINKNGSISVVGKLVGVGEKKEKAIVQVSQDFEVDALYQFYIMNIRSTSRLTLGGFKKIQERLKTYSGEELRVAMLNFSRDSWWMQNNSGRGVEWFFNSDKRIDQFLNLDVKETGPVTIK
jgi:hypothetical protein